MNNTACRTILSGMLAILLVFPAMPSLAKVAVEEAAKLRTELNPMGGERAGNKEGTIPEWTGGVSKIPEGIDYVAKSGLPIPNPFAEDKILFTITAQNVDQYKDKLSPGIARLFKRYPETFKMHIYPTRRSAAYSKEHYEGTYKNALTGEIVDEYGSVKNICKGIPFPIAKSGAEAMINFVLRPVGVEFIICSMGGGVIQANGRSTEMSARNVYMYNLNFARRIINKEETIWESCYKGR